MPVFVEGLLQIDSERAPAANSDAYRFVVRDAYLLAGRGLPTGLDGRVLMSLRDRGEIPPVARAADRDLDHELLELAHRTREPAGNWAHVATQVRQGVLAQLRAEEARQAHAEQTAFCERIAQGVHGARSEP
jgi:hypothetical protein